MLRFLLTTWYALPLPLRATLMIASIIITGIVSLVMWDWPYVAAGGIISFLLWLLPGSSDAEKKGYHF